MSSASPNTCLLKQCEERTNGLNRDLARKRDELHQMELDEADKVIELQDTLESQIIDFSVKLRSCCLPHVPDLKL